jgi:hypothetical protein
MTMQVIQHYEVPSNQSSISFTSIPTDGTYTDLLIRYSLRHTTAAVDPGNFYFNNDTAGNYGMKLLLSDGANYGSFSNASYLAQYNNWSGIFLNPSSATAGIFNNIEVYIPDYASTNRYKPVNVMCVNENNATGAFTSTSAGIWNSNSAINAITITSSTGLIAQYSSATLYGITAGSDGVTTVS